MVSVALMAIFTCNAINTCQKGVTTYWGASDRVLDVDPEQDEFNSAVDQMDTALATYAAIAESAMPSDTTGCALTTPAIVIEATTTASDASAGTRTAVAQAESGGGQRTGSGQRPI